MVQLVVQTQRPQLAMPSNLHDLEGSLTKPTPSRLSVANRHSLEFVSNIFENSNLILRVSRFLPLVTRQHLEVNAQVLFVPLGKTEQDAILSVRRIRRIWVHRIILPPAGHLSVAFGESLYELRDLPSRESISSQVVIDQLFLLRERGLVVTLDEEYFV